MASTTIADPLGPTTLVRGGAPQPGQPYWNAGTVNTEPGIKLSLQQLVDLAIQAGFPRTGPGNAAQAAAVAEYESSGMPGWYNPEYSVQPTGSTQGSYGLTQIYRAAHSSVAQQFNLLDPLGNFEAALAITRQNVAAGKPPWTGWTSVYGNSGVGIPAGGYARYLPAATADVAKSTATVSTVDLFPSGSGSGNGGGLNPIQQAEFDAGSAAGKVAAGGVPVVSGVTNAAQAAADLPSAIAALPGNLVSAFQADIVKAGFLAFAALIIIIGVVLLVAPAAERAGEAGARVAGMVAAPETGGASLAVEKLA